MIARVEPTGDSLAAPRNHERSAGLKLYPANLLVPGNRCDAESELSGDQS